MASRKHPGLDALEKCEDQVKISIRNEVKVISKYLKDNAIIDRPLYNDVNNPESKDIPEAKATKLYLKLLGEVENDEAYYLKFVEFLRNNPKFNNTVAKLDGAYTGEGEKGGKLDKPQTAHDKPPAVVAVPIGASQPSIVMPTVDSQPSPAEILHKLVHHVGIDISKLTESPDDNKLRDISDHQGAEWESCATKLGLSLGDINDIKTDHKMVKEQRFRALTLWKQRQSFMATYKVLVEVFISLKHVDLAKYVCELLK